MRYRKLMFMLVLAILIFGAASVCASDMNDTVVASDDDSAFELSQADAGDMISSDEDELIGQRENELINEGDSGTFAELQADINAAANASTLTLNKSYECEDGFDTAGILINKTITIDGNGFKIDAQGKSRIFKIPAENVILKNIIFINGNTDEYGGAVYFHHAGTVTNCNFVDNKATGYYGYGGAICIERGAVTNCNFTGNSAGHGGGAIEMTYATVGNCNFTNNTANQGGAFRSNSGNVSNCHFTDNAANEGGAVYFFNKGAVTNCNFVNNSANLGGAIYSYQWFSPADTCIFKANSSENVNTVILSPVLSVDNFTTVYGSGDKLTFDLKTNSSIPVTDGNISISVYFKDNNTWVGNYTCLSGDGWTVNLPVGSYYAIFSTEYAGAQSVNRTVTVTIPNVRYYINITSVRSNIGTVSITAKTDIQKDMLWDGRLIFILPNGTEIVADYEGNGIWGASYTFAEIGVYEINAKYVGLENIDVNKGNVTFGPEPVYSFLAHEIGSGGNIVLQFDHYTYDNGGTITITQSGVIDGRGAVIDMAGSNIRAFNVTASGVTIKNLTIKNANCKGNGGAIYFNSSGTVINCNFTDNKVTGLYGEGAAVFFEKSGNVTNCNFVNNSATFYGGAINMFSGNVTNCNFTGIKASNSGGAVFFYNQGTVTNCNFINITSTSKGGAVFIYDQGTVTNCIFNGNKASNSGGAVYFNSKSVVRNCNFIDNTAYEDGGAVYFNSKGEVANCNFTGNKATGNYGFGGAVLFYNQGTVTNCNFNNNTATSQGGAIRLKSIAEVTDCNFTGNNATTGSAIYFYDTYVSKTVSNSRFFNNRANAEALEITKNGDNIEITFTGRNNLLNAIYFEGPVTFTNVEYWGANGITTVSDTISGSNKEAGQNITVLVFNGSLVLNEVKVTDADGRIALNIDIGDNYYISARHDSDSYYTEVEKTISYMAFNVNVTSQTTTNKTVNITAKSNIYSEFMPGKLLFILPNGTQITANPGANGTWWAIHTFDACDDYQVNATYMGLDNVIITNATITISKTPTNISVLNDTIVLEVLDEVAAGVSLTPADAGNVTYTVSNSSVVKVENDKIIAVGEGNAVITVSFAGSKDYAAAENKTISVTVNLKDAGVSVNNKTLDLLIGDEFSVVVTTVPEGLDVTFTPDNSGIVSVDENGVITALKEGKATVKVSVGGDGVYALNTTDVSVTVKKIPTEIIANDTVNMHVGDVARDIAGLKPVTAGNLTYTSSNPSVVKVENGKIIAVGEGSTNITVSFAGDDKYVAAENKTISVTVNLNDASVSVNKATLDLVVKDTFNLVATTVPKGLNVSYSSTNESVVTVDGKGIVTAVGTGKATIVVTVGDDKVYAVNSTNVTVTVRQATSITAAGVSTTYNINKNLVITLKDGNGKALANVKLTIVLNGAKTYTTDKNGQVKVSTKGLAPKKYTAKVTFNGDAVYGKSSKDIKVTVKKATPKLTAKKKTFKRSVKVKKYSIVLKNNVGKAIKKAKVTIKIGKKTFKAKTNSKGKATFKIKKLTKKGTYKAKVSFKGNKYYNKVTKKVKIRIK